MNLHTEQVVTAVTLLTHIL